MRYEPPIMLICTNDLRVDLLDETLLPTDRMINYLTARPVRNDKCVKPKSYFRISFQMSVTVLQNYSSSISSLVKRHLWNTLHSLLNKLNPNSIYMRLPVPGDPFSNTFCLSWMNCSSFKWGRRTTAFCLVPLKAFSLES